MHAGLKQKVKDSEAQNPLNRVKNIFLVIHLQKVLYWASFSFTYGGRNA